MPNKLTPVRYLNLFNLILDVKGRDKELQTEVKRLVNDVQILKTVPNNLTKKSLSNLASNMTMLVPEITNIKHDSNLLMLKNGLLQNKDNQLKEDYQKLTVMTNNLKFNYNFLKETNTQLTKNISILKTRSASLDNTSKDLRSNLYPLQESFQNFNEFI